MLGNEVKRRPATGLQLLWELKVDIATMIKEETSLILVVFLNHLYEPL